MIASILVASALSCGAATAPAAPAAAKERPRWLKVYPLSPRREAWNGTVEVKKLDGVAEKVVAAAEKNGGRLTQPLQTFPVDVHERQLVLVVPLKNATALLKAMRKLGTAADPDVRSVSEAAPIAEVKEKLSRLLKERAEQPAAYALTPASAEATDEIIEHLSAVVAADRAAVPEVLWNVTLRERP